METKQKAFKLAKIFIEEYLRYNPSFEVQSPAAEFGQKADPQHCKEKHIYYYWIFFINKKRNMYSIKTYMNIDNIGSYIFWFI